MTHDLGRLQALALEAYAASSEKAVQLLAELHRRLRDRSEQAESLMHAASGQTGSPNSAIYAYKYCP